jgi:hypothetical protein
MPDRKINPYRVKNSAVIGREIIARGCGYTSETLGHQKMNKV